MKHTHKQIGENTGRIVFESSVFLVPDRKPEIVRYAIDKSGKPYVTRGAVLGRQSGKPCALVIDVRRRDIVSIRENICVLTGFSWRYFGIDDEFQPLPLSLPSRRITVAEFGSMRGTYNDGGVPQVDLSEESMRSFLAETHPEWLDHILTRQINYWRVTKPASLFRLAPAHMTENDLRNCVRKEPFLALAHSKHRLTKGQLAACVRGSLRGAVMYASEMLTPEQLEESIYEHPKEAILFVWNKLTDGELRICASNHPFTAFRMRVKMPPEKRAIMLARSYQYTFLANFGKPLPGLQEEIIDSIIHYPDEWLRCHNNDYGKLFHGLEVYVDLKNRSWIAMTLLEGMAEEHRPLLARFVGRL